MRTVEFFQKLTLCTCQFCGHDIAEDTGCPYTNVCKDCLEVMEEA